MNFLASTTVLVLLLCGLGNTSFIPDKEPLKDIHRYHSSLKFPSSSSSPAFESEGTVLTACGGVLNSATGGIAYKAFDPIDPNERCVWTIRGANTNSITVNVLRLGLSPSIKQSGVILTCLKHQAEPQHTVLTRTGVVEGENNCNVAIVTLATGENVANSTGIVIEYSASGQADISPDSQDYIVEVADAGLFSYPDSTRTRYDSYELTTIVFIPTAAALGQNRRTNLMYIRRSLEQSNCYDNVNIYTLNAGSTGPIKWQHEGTICGDTPGENIVNGDIILVIFESDQSVTGAGFQLAYIETTGSECQK